MTVVIALIIAAVVGYAFYRLANKGKGGARYGDKPDTDKR